MTANILATQPTPDSPVPFGYKMAWYAIRTTNSQAVADALGIRSQHPANWKEGFKEAYAGDSVFISPSVSGWIFVVGFPIFPDLKPVPDEKCLARLKDLSKQFGEAQLFATHRGVSSHAWAKATGGSLLRAFGYSGDQGQDVWGVGKQTQEEIDLGLTFPTGKQPDEEDVMKLAGRWSLNPQLLNKSQASPSAGIVGKL